MKKILFLALLTGSFVFAQSKSVDNAVNKTARVAESAINNSADVVKAALPSKNTGGAVKEGVSTFYGDIKEGTTTVYSDVKDVVKTLTPEARDLLTKTANKLEKTTNQVWDILVKQQRVWSICYLFMTISAMVLWYRFGIAFDVMKTDVTEAGETKESNILLVAIYGVLAVFLSILSSQHFIDMVTGFYNPEYGAMKHIIEFYQTIK